MLQCFPSCMSTYVEGPRAALQHVLSDSSQPLQTTNLWTSALLKRVVWLNHRWLAAGTLARQRQL